MQNTLPHIQTVDLKTWQEERSITLVTSPSAQAAAQYFLRSLRIEQTIYITSSQKAAVDVLLEQYDKPTVIYAVGGGQVCDIARYLAAAWGAEVVCVPSAITSDAFLVDSTGLREKGCVYYAPAKSADIVLIDWRLLASAPASLHIGGCGDVLSIYTGLWDWRYANDQHKAQSDEHYDESVALMAQAIFDSLLKAAPAIKVGKDKGISTLITCLAMEVALCNMYGNSRPEEGGEHFFAYCIENKIPHFLHGEMVSFGILITAFIQNQDWRSMRDSLDNLGINYLPSALTRDAVTATLRELPAYVVEHNLRYSIYNTFSYDKYTDKINSFLSELGVA